jgi:SAM-dependent methyltransferase
VGVDYSADIIDVAQSHLEKAEGWSNVTFQAASVFELPFEDNHFDVVYSHQMFPHLPNPVDAFKEIRRVMKPGGMVATRDADTFAWSPSLPGLDLTTTALGRKLRMGGSTFPPGREMHRWAREAGFSREKMTVGGGATVYNSKEEREWWGGVLVGAFTEDGGYPQKTIESGTSEGEIEVMVRDLRIWMEDQDGWYGVLNSENIYRK